MHCASHTTDYGNFSITLNRTRARVRGRERSRCGRTRGVYNRVRVRHARPNVTKAALATSKHQREFTQRQY